MKRFSKKLQNSKSVSLEHFIELKPLICEECNNDILLESPLVAIRVPPTNKEAKSIAPKPTEVPAIKAVLLLSLAVFLELKSSSISGSPDKDSMISKSKNISNGDIFRANWSYFLKACFFTYLLVCFGLLG